MSKVASSSGRVKTGPCLTDESSGLPPVFPPSLEPSSHVCWVYRTEKASASLCDSSAELMSRKLHLPCLVLRAIPRVNNAGAKAKRVRPPLTSTPPPTTHTHTHRKCVYFLRTRSNLTLQKQVASKQGVDCQHLALKYPKINKSTSRQGPLSGSPSFPLSSADREFKRNREPAPRDSTPSI